MEPSLKIDEMSIVALGRFNPAIFQPLWFSGSNLLPEDEATTAEVRIIHPEVASFSTDWLNLQVTQDKCIFESADSSRRQSLRDLVAGTFKLLEHTPIRAFGFNRHQHYQMSSKEQWDSLGHHYAPKETWEGLLVEPGLRSLVIEGCRDGGTANRIQVRVEPSTKVSPGVHISVNEHYDVGSDEDEGTTASVSGFLSAMQDSWEDFFLYTDSVVEGVLNYRTKDEE